MAILYIFLGLVLGGGIGYGYFYYSFKDKKIIETLKQNLEERTQENENLIEENNELIEENDFLREEAARLDTENKNYKDIVARFQSNAHLIEKVTDLVKESANILGIYDKEVEFEMKKVIGAELHKKEDEDEQPSKKYF